MANGFPNSKIELHQWANSIMMLIIGFIAAATYNEIHADHEKIAEHETKLAVHEVRINDIEKKADGGKKTSANYVVHQPADLPKQLEPQEDND